MCRYKEPWPKRWAYGFGVEGFGVQGSGVLGFKGSGRLGFFVLQVVYFFLAVKSSRSRPPKLLDCKTLNPQRTVPEIMFRPVDPEAHLLMSDM